MTLTETFLRPEVVDLLMVPTRKNYVPLLVLSLTHPCLTPLTNQAKDPSSRQIAQELRGTISTSAKYHILPQTVLLDVEF